jgi:hypothetical protein
VIRGEEEMLVCNVDVFVGNLFVYVGNFPGKIFLSPQRETFARKNKLFVKKRK